MEINNNLDNYYDQLLMDNNVEGLKSKSSGIDNSIKKNDIKLVKNDNSQDDKKLKLLANEFTSILMKQMFKSMRNTVPEGELMDGGFSEDVFTDMLDGELSKLGAEQKGFSNLGRLLYEQLKTKMED